MNYINTSVSHWFVFCEALYLFRLLRAKAYKDRVRWYILTGWRKSLHGEDRRPRKLLGSFSGTADSDHRDLCDKVHDENELGDLLVRTIDLRLDSSRSKYHLADCKVAYEKPLISLFSV
jgi:hypothetical protein